MLGKFKKRILQISVLSLLIAPGFAVATVSAQANIQGASCQGSDLQFGAPVDCVAATAEGETKINTLITQIINVFSIIVGIVAVIMMIYGGFRYITSGGDSGNVTSAKNTILYAIIGLIIVALAQFIVKFVLNKATTAGP